MQMQTVRRKLISEGGEYAAARLVRYAEGEPGDPATWQGVAQQMGVGVHLYEAPGAGRGEFIAPPPDGEPARIAINTAYPPREVAAAYIHELSEVLLRQMQPPLFPSEADCGRYEGEPGDVLHLASRKAERVILGS